MSKENTQWVLVETVSMCRHRYMVEVPVGESTWALDSVVMEEAKEFSQEHLGETIASHRVVTEEEAISLCDVDNNYCASWSDEKKKEVFFTSSIDVSQNETVEPPETEQPRLRANPWRVLEDALDAGIAYGLNRADKHAVDVLTDAQRQRVTTAVYDAVMLEMDERFMWDDEV